MIITIKVIKCHYHLVLVSSLLLVANSDGSSSAGQFRTLFEYPSDALGINDLEGQEAAPIVTFEKFR